MKSLRAFHRPPDVKMIVLALNSGSNSLKFEVVKTPPEGSSHFGRTLLSGVYDNIGKEHGTFSLLDGAKVVHREERQLRDYWHTAKTLCGWIESGAGGHSEIHSFSDIECIGHRVVHGAHLFAGPAVINQDVISRIEGLADLAPLHNKPALSVIRAVEENNPNHVPAVAVFDTTFHRTIPDDAALYALPRELSERHKIKRYGFHGISHRYLMLRYCQITGCKPEDTKLITAHLEGGSSVAAIRGGRSVETSMGFTPLEGLVMGTRTGDLDPAIVPYLMRKENMNTEQIEEFLNKQCGLLALSGVSADTRELVKKLDQPAVELALAIFCHRVRKYLGAYLAILEGADAIILGGGISENTPMVRERLCRGLAWFGIDFDDERNGETIDREGEITIPGARLPVWVIPTHENLMLANEAAQCVAAQSNN